MTPQVIATWLLTWGTTDQEALSYKGLPVTPGAWMGKACKAREAGREIVSTLSLFSHLPRLPGCHTPGFPPTSQVLPPAPTLTTKCQRVLGPLLFPIQLTPSLLGNLLTLNITSVLVPQFLSLLS